MNNLNVEVWTITPEKARVYLQNCSRENRAINRNRVLFYAKQMKDGQWQMNGETIIFSDKGVLLNGYHRMNAVVEANVPVAFLVVQNVSEDAFKTIDTGKPRSVGDVYKMSNILNSTRVASIVRKFVQLKSGFNSATDENHGSFQTLRLSNSDMLGVYYEAPEVFQEFCNYASCLRDRYNLFAVSEVGGVMSYLHLVLGYDKEKIYEFFNILYQYNLEQPKDFLPAQLLRTRIIQTALKNQKMSLRYKQQLLAKVWNLWREGNEVKTLKVGENEIVRFE